MGSCVVRRGALGRSLLRRADEPLRARWAVAAWCSLGRTGGRGGQERPRWRCWRTCAPAMCQLKGFLHQTRGSRAEKAADVSPSVPSGRRGSATGPVICVSCCWVSEWPSLCTNSTSASVGLRCGNCLSGSRRIAHSLVVPHSPNSANFYQSFVSLTTWELISNYPYFCQSFAGITLWVDGLLTINNRLYNKAVRNVLYKLITNDYILTPWVHHICSVSQYFTKLLLRNFFLFLFPKLFNCKMIAFHFGMMFWVAWRGAPTTAPVWVGRTGSVSELYIGWHLWTSFFHSRTWMKEEAWSVRCEYIFSNVYVRAGELFLCIALYSIYNLQ